MWNAFPKPKWPPIQDMESVDLAGKRQDGGVDHCIVATQPLDDAPDTLNSIRSKVACYLDVIDAPEFRANLDYPSRNQTTIVIACDHPIHSKAQAVIEECRAAADDVGCGLKYERQ
jgi:hypothetical protein